MMPMFEIAMISRLCKSAEFQAQIGKARSDCSKAVYQVRQVCTKAFHDKFPRADDAEVDGRMSFRNFSADYMQCLENSYAESVIRDASQ